MKSRFTAQFKVIATVVMLYALVVACSTLREMTRAKPNRGVFANHEFHVQEGMDCTDCHEFSPGERATFPDHETCSICHDIPEDTIADASCSMCHTRNDYSVWPQRVVLTEEINFDHTVHLAAAVSCTECHANPDGAPVAAGRLMPLCMDCHENREFEFASIADSGVVGKIFRANECSVCHKELDLDTVPTHRHGTRLAHDSPHAWETLHGSESQLSPQFCGHCHDEQEHCADCHRVTKPQSHTPSWSRKMHGLQAAWDRRSCSVCHEEDSCMKCHDSTQPSSHRGSFDAPQNTHCVQCHFPPENNCAICHQSIEHRSAPRTPHDVEGGFPGDCKLCHPGGVGGAVPHLNNFTVNCTFCHR